MTIDIASYLIGMVMGGAFVVVGYLANEWSQRDSR